MLEYDEGEDALPTLSRPVIRVPEHSAQGARQVFIQADAVMIVVVFAKPSSPYNDEEV